MHVYASAHAHMLNTHSTELYIIYMMSIKSDGSMGDQRLLSQGWLTGHYKIYKLRCLDLTVGM